MNIFTKLINFFNTSKSESESGKNSTSLTISKHLQDFLENEVLDGLDITKDQFWSSFEKIINEFSPRNKALLQKREGAERRAVSISLSPVYFIFFSFCKFFQF